MAKGDREEDYPFQIPKGAVPVYSAYGSATVIFLANGFITTHTLLAQLEAMRMTLPVSAPISGLFVPVATVGALLLAEQGIIGYIIPNQVHDSKEECDSDEDKIGDFVSPVTGKNQSEPDYH